MKKSTILKIFFTVLLLAVLVIKVNFSEILSIIFSLNLFYLAGALLLVPVLYAIRTVRWNVFLHSVGITLPFVQSFKILLIGNFYGLVTPGKVGELGRAYHLNEKKVVTIPTIIFEKMIDILTLIILSLLTIIFYFQKSTFMQGGILLCCISVILIILLLTNKKAVFFIAKLFTIKQDNSEQFFENFLGMLHNYPIIAYAFLISIIYYIVAYVLGYLIILSAGFNSIVIITLPIIVLIGNIPITISGLGLRESVGSLAFVYLGETAADGFVFAFLLFILITVIPGIFGYMLTMKEI
jgi:glycosyltransferase 2 family protein